MAAWAVQARHTSREAARALALTIVHQRSPVLYTYDLGIVLSDSETAWQRAPADYWWRGERSWIVQHNSYRGYRSTINEVHQPCMYRAGMLDWLITNQRLAARRPDGQVVSIYWSAIEAIGVDLAHEIVVVDGADGYHGELRGPAIALIAVAAIAACLGPQALLDHPALELLRAPPNEVEEKLLTEVRDRIRRAGDDLRTNHLPRLTTWCDHCDRCDLAALCRDKP